MNSYFPHRHGAVQRRVEALEAYAHVLGLSGSRDLFHAIQNNPQYGRERRADAWADAWIDLMATEGRGPVVQAVVQAVIQKAKSGDMTAARIILDRLAPLRRGTPDTIRAA